MYAGFILFPSFRSVVKLTEKTEYHFMFGVVAGVCVCMCVVRGVCFKNTIKTLKWYDVY